jgi:hypothetical protein
MVILRLVAIMFLGFAAIAVGVELFDFVRTMRWTPVTAARLWQNLDPSSFAAIQSFIERRVLPSLWDPVMVWILRQPAWLVATIPGLTMLLFSIDWHQDMPHGWDSEGKRERPRLQRSH